MNKRILTSETVKEFKDHLANEEKCSSTIEKYIRDVSAFKAYCKHLEITKDTVIAYKQALIKMGYATRSINSMLTSINVLFTFKGWFDLKVKTVKIQKQVYSTEEKELTKEEYIRLCAAASQKQNQRLYLILQTICSTGIRISELQFITVQALQKGEATVHLKGKTRSVILPNELKQKLLCYTAEQNIKTGIIFATKTGKALDRTNIWREMKALCAKANVNPEKVYPHNLRHLFARVFYDVDKDIAKLADVLGHSSIETTRIYIVGTGVEHRKLIENMKLIL